MAMAMAMAMAMESLFNKHQTRQLIGLENNQKKGQSNI